MLFLQKDRRRVRTLVQKLGSRDGATRVVAELELLRLPPCRHNLLVSELDREVRRVRHLPALAGTAAASQLACFGMVHVFYPAADPVSYIWPAIAAGAISLANLASTRNAAARVMSGFEDSRLIEPLARALATVDEETRPFVSDGLVRLLRARASNGSRSLPYSHLSALSRCLRVCDAELAHAILDLLMDARAVFAIPEVASVARGEVPAASYRVQAHASHCLRKLSALADAARTGSLLLRPASNPTGPAETLLRPVSSPVQPNRPLLRVPHSGCD